MTTARSSVWSRSSTRDGSACHLGATSDARRSPAAHGHLSQETRLNETESTAEPPRNTVRLSPSNPARAETPAAGAHRPVPVEQQVGEQRRTRGFQRWNLALPNPKMHAAEQPCLARLPPSSTPARIGAQSRRPDCPIGVYEWKRALKGHEQPARQGGLHHRLVRTRTCSSPPPPKPPAFSGALRRELRPHRHHQRSTRPLARSTRIPQLSPTPRRQLAPRTSRHVGRSDRRDPLL